MNQFENEPFYAYECFSGCGHKTLTNKAYNKRKPHCSVCGEKSEMRYVGEFTVTPINKHKIDLGLNNPR